MLFTAVDHQLVASDAFTSRRGGAATSRVAALQLLTATMLRTAQLTAPEYEMGEVLDRDTPRSDAPDVGNAAGRGGESEIFESSIAREEAEALEGFGLAPITETLPEETWAAPISELAGVTSRATVLVIDLAPDATAARRLTPLKQVYQDFDSAPDALGLKALLEASLVGPTALERVASAQILDSLSRGRHAAAVEALVRGVKSASEEIRSIAELSSVDTPQARDPEPEAKLQPKGANGPVSCTFHGTWARLAVTPWYVPGSALHQHIQYSVSLNLYDQDDYPRWSGGYSDSDRTQGAHSLLDWVHNHTGGHYLDAVYAHSHGGNVVLEAIERGLSVDTLVLLHVPPRRRSDAEWAAIRARVRRTLVYRVGLDRVVLADMIRARAIGNAAAQRFDPVKLPHVDSEPHPINGPWFKHGYYTELGSWTRHHVAGDINYYRGQPPMR